MEPSREQIYLWHNNPKNWKGYFFYFNKDDNRVMVDKRNPRFGATLNFANPKSYIVLLVAVSFFGFVVYMIDKNGG